MRLHSNDDYSDNKTANLSLDDHLLAIDSSIVDERSRLTLTKRIKKMLSVEPEDIVAFYQDSRRGDIVLRIQRGNALLGSWRMARCDFLSDGDSGAWPSSESVRSLDRQQLQQPSSAAKPYPILETTAADLASKHTDIMLVDDEPDVLDTIKTMLEIRGYKVDSFSESRKALRHFTDMEPSHYKLVISDIRMPDLNGFELMRGIKTWDRSAKVLFVSALDAYEMIDALPEVRELGGEVRWFLKKPISTNQLIDKVERAINKEKSSQDLDN